MKPVIAILAATILSGCANAVSSPSWDLLQSGLGGPTEADRLEHELSEISQPTVANKTLSAMALERATGRKPDPSRLIKFD